MEKIDLTRLYKPCYTAKNTPELIDFGPANYVSMPGKGDPSGETFAANISTLYPVAYGVKALAKAMGKDFGVPKLEGLWWFDVQKFGNPAMSEAPTVIPRGEWEYRLLIRMPDFVDETMVERAIETVVSKKGLVAAAKVAFFTLHEGLCVQMMHTGSYADEPASLQKIHDFCANKNLTQNGLHHEIYLSDFRKTPPEKLKTILREPVK